MPRRLPCLLSLLALSAAALGACGRAEPAVLRLATTTSTADSGLLDAILPGFEETHNARVDVVAVGTGQALELGQNGDADVILVHARSGEDAFVADEYGLARYDVMHNDFIVVGPPDDPAGTQGMASAAEAFTAIAEAQAPFASRGDDSGTHTKEQVIWQLAAIEPDPDQGWYFSLGQGMGETLQFASERGAYTLADRGTYLFLRDNLPGLVTLFGGDSINENRDLVLHNPYGVIPVNPILHDGIQADLARQFVEWLTSLETQEKIGAYGVDVFGQPLFYPDSEAYRQAHP